MNLCIKKKSKDSKMKAIRINEFKQDFPQIEDAPIPSPNNGEVQIKVTAASINPVDWKTSQGGGIAGLLEDPFPYTLGYDVSGTVSAVGDNVTQFSVGDEVFGMINFFGKGGAFAEYAVAPASQLVKKPINLSHKEAAALPLVTLTAWQALFEIANLTKGKRILIHAAAGGVGHIAVQLAKWKGATVIGTASEQNREFVTGLGVDTFIDYRVESFEALLKDNPVDVVLDTIGGETLDKSLQIVKPGGTVASIVKNPNDLTVPDNVKAEFVLVSDNQAQLTTIKQLVESHQLAPTVSQTFSIKDVSKAFEISKGGHVRGKLVLDVA